MLDCGRDTKGLFIVLLVAASAASYAGTAKGPIGPWAMTSITVDGAVFKLGGFPTHADCEKAIPQTERQQHTTNAQCVLAPLGAYGVPPPNPWDMTVTMSDGKLKMVVAYASKAACEQDIPDVEASLDASSGHCDPGLPGTTSLPDLLAEACPSPAPTTMQDWEKRHAALVQVCAGVELDCGDMARNVLCYEGKYRWLPPACRAALIELGCTAQGLAVAAKQEAEWQAKDVGHPACTPDQITISNRTQTGYAQRWNATCNGKVYLCSGYFRGAYSCAPVAK